MSNVTTFRRSADLATIVEALNPIRIAEILERCTVYPFVVTVTYQYGVAYDDVSFKRCTVAREIVQAPMHRPPQGEDFVPAGGLFCRADIFPATRFDDMPVAVRANYKAEYRAYLTWKKAHSLGKKVADLIPWEELDPILRDGDVERWARGVE